MLNKKICVECASKKGLNIRPEPFVNWPCPIRSKEGWPWVNRHEDPPEGCLRRFEQAVAAGVKDA